MLQFKTCTVFLQSTWKIQFLVRILAGNFLKVIIQAHFTNYCEYFIVLQMAGGPCITAILWWNFMRINCIISEESTTLGQWVIHKRWWSWLTECHSENLNFGSFKKFGINLDGCFWYFLVGRPICNLKLDWQPIYFHYSSEHQFISLLITLHYVSNVTQKRGPLQSNQRQSNPVWLHLWFNQIKSNHPARL